eukprot:3554159-Pyramimonas_sp.AAC.1
MVRPMTKSIVISIERSIVRSTVRSTGDIRRWPAPDRAVPEKQQACAIPERLPRGTQEAPKSPPRGP